MQKAALCAMASFAAIGLAIATMFNSKSDSGEKNVLLEEDPIDWDF